MVRVIPKYTCTTNRYSAASVPVRRSQRLGPCRAVGPTACRPSPGHTRALTVNGRSRWCVFELMAKPRRADNEHRSPCSVYMYEVTFMRFPLSRVAPSGRWLLSFMLWLIATPTWALEPMDPTAVCQRISTYQGEADCLRAIEGVFIDPLAAAACDRIPSNEATVACMRAIAGRRISPRLVQLCDAETGSWQTVRCFSGGAGYESPPQPQQPPFYPPPPGRPHWPRPDVGQHPPRGEGGCNIHGCYPPGGGCNVHGCYPPGGGCNVHGCYPSGGDCNVHGCFSAGGGCNVHGCWSYGGGCNVHGCFRTGGGCNVHGCWHSPQGSCNVHGCSNSGTCSVHGCPP